MNKKIKLDKKDLKILEILDFDARETNSSIAKNLMLSKPAIEYRINRLIKNKVIEGFYTVIDIGKLGFVPYRISIKLQDLNDDRQKELLEYMKTNDNVGWLFSLGGKWDIALTVYSKNIREFEKASKQILNMFTKNILEKTISIVTSIHNYPNKFLYGTNKYKEIIVGQEIQNHLVDHLDRKILLELSQNSRQPVLTLSQKINENPRTILYRIKRLEKNKIILGYRTKINTEILGYSHYKVFLYLKNTNKDTEKKIRAYIKTLNNSIYYTSAIGIADTEFELKVKHPEEAYQIIDGIRKKFDTSIINFEILLIRKEHLIKYLPKIK